MREFRFTAVSGMEILPVKSPEVTMSCSHKKYLLSFLSLGILCVFLVPGNAWEADGGVGTGIGREREANRLRLIEKASTDTLDFSEEEIQELARVAHWAVLRGDFSDIALCKLSDLGSSASPFILWDVLKTVVQHRALLEKASTNTLDFSDEEIQELVRIAYSLVNRSDTFLPAGIVLRKLSELGPKASRFLSDERLKNEVQRQALVDKAATDTLDFSEEEIQELADIADRTLERYPASAITLRKLSELGPKASRFISNEVKERIRQRMLIDKATTDTLDFSDDEIRELVYIKRWSIERGSASGIAVRKLLELWPFASRSVTEEDQLKRRLRNIELYERAATDSLDFSDDEIREFISVASSGHDDFGIGEATCARRKLYDFGESIQPILIEMALDSTSFVVKGANFLTLFVRSRDEKINTESRKVVLAMLEEKPTRFNIYRCCYTIGRIGEPEDVPKLLSYMNAERDAILDVLRPTGRIAAVSQIPEIEKAVAQWEKKYPTDNEEWRERYRDEVKKCLANIRKRNVQWTPSETDASVVE